MPGVRIHHPTLRSCTLLVPHPGGIEQGRKRNPKDYHIHLDNDGNCIVSETVWKRLKQAEPHSKHGFIVLNEVLDPPTLVVGSTSGGIQQKVFRQEYDVVREMAPSGVMPRIVER